MKVAIAALIALTLSACASAPQTKQEHDALAMRSCLGETANQRGVAISQFTQMSSGQYALHECLYRHGVRASRN